MKDSTDAYIKQTAMQGTDLQTAYERASSVQDDISFAEFCREVEDRRREYKGRVLEYLDSHWEPIEGASLEDWKYEVANDDTRLGYHDWARNKLEMGQEDCPICGGDHPYEGKDCRGYYPKGAEQRDAPIRQMLPEDADWLIATKERD